MMAFIFLNLKVYNLQMNIYYKYDGGKMPANGSRIGDGRDF